MGTRNLTCVRIDGDFKVAQYGQWDGYPEGQGKTALEFLQSQSVDNYEAFKRAVRQCRWATEEDWKLWREHAGIEDGKNWITMEQSYKFDEIAPQVSRDNGAKILGIVLKAEPGLALKDSHTFAGDSLFCEWCYVIDFDRDVFEVYGGFNTSKPVGLFADYKPREAVDGMQEYSPVTLLKSYSLMELPSLEQFLADLTKEEEEEAGV